MATLLIVDDDNLVRDQLCELLSPSHECHTADRAEQALAYLDIETYDAVLTDIFMPGFSGRDLLKYIQAKHPSTQVIVMTGMLNADDEPDGKEYLNLGAFAFFAKPFKLEEIEAAVERAVARHKELASADQPEPTETEPPPDTDPVN